MFDKYEKDPHKSDKGVVVLLSDPETDQYIQEVSNLSSDVISDVIMTSSFDVHHKISLTNGHLTRQLITRRRVISIEYLVTGLKSQKKFFHNERIF